jgi:general stress protein 26
MKQPPAEKFHELLKDFDTAVLITHGEETHFRARPMAIARVDYNCDLWFITSEDSAKVHEIEADTRVQIVCQKGWTSCVSIAGRASLSRDRQKIRELWKTSYQVWFPRGVDDPNIVLLHVTGEHGEYWDNTGANRFTYVYRAIKAVVTGTTPEVTEGEQHGHVSLRMGGSGT